MKESSFIKSDYRKRTARKVLIKNKYLSGTVLAWVVNKRAGEREGFWNSGLRLDYSELLLTLFTTFLTRQRDQTINSPSKINH